MDQRRDPGRNCADRGESCWGHSRPLPPHLALPAPRSGEQRRRLREINQRQPQVTFERPLRWPSEEPPRTKAAFPKARQVPTHTLSPDRTGASHLKSSRISRLSAWKGMFRTRILEVVCFLGTCFFRVDVRAGLESGEGARSHGGQCCCLALTRRPQNRCPSHAPVSGSGREWLRPQGRRPLPGDMDHDHLLWSAHPTHGVSCLHLRDLGASSRFQARKRAVDENRSPARSPAPPVPCSPGKPRSMDAGRVTAQP